MKKEYQKHPEWTDKYSAINGIGKDGECLPESDLGQPRYSSSHRPIRSDIEKILNFNEDNFYGWLSQRRTATKKLLSKYKLFASIPHLSYASEDQKLDMTARTHVKDHIAEFEQGLDYLEKIEQVYKEIHGK